MFSRRGSPRGPNATIASTAHAASAPPTAAPRAEISRLSVMSCRMMRPRPAPSAVRTAISVSRDDARTSSRFATFAHAMSSTNPTAPNIVYKQPRDVADDAIPEGPAPFRRTSRSIRGYSFCSRSPTLDMSRFAASTVTPGRSRAIAEMKCAPRFSGSVIHGSNTNGIQRSG